MQCSCLHSCMLAQAEQGRCSSSAEGGDATPSRILGVLGGMGPAATADFLKKLIELTPAQRDQDHIATLVCSIPQVPDRNDAILNGGPSPLPAMTRALAVLERCGASVAAIPCNTAHFWFDDLQHGSGLRIVHIVDAALQSIRLYHASVNAVGLLATNATVHARVYADRLTRSGVECLVPDARDQERIMQVIRSIKAAETVEQGTCVIDRVADRLIARGAASVILGCSELPLILQGRTSPYIDATEALARACVRIFKDARGLHRA